MKIREFFPLYEVVRDPARCIKCRLCERECANEVHAWNEKLGVLTADDTRCVNCQRCVAVCPTRALKIVHTQNTYKDNANWTMPAMREIYQQAQTGGVLLASMGNPQPGPIYWDKLLLNASQVTNPPIDPLREPMETRVFLGKKPGCIQRGPDGKLVPNQTPQLALRKPILFSAMSYGSISYNAHAALARAAERLGIYYNTGEGVCTRTSMPTGSTPLYRWRPAGSACTPITWARARPSRSRWDRAQSRASAATCRASRSGRISPRPA